MATLVLVAGCSVVAGGRDDGSCDSTSGSGGVSIILHITKLFVCEASSLLINCYNNIYLRYIHSVWLCGLNLETLKKHLQIPYK